MDGQAQVVERLVVLFPSLAAWVIVGLLVLIGAIVAALGRKFLIRMDAQDTALGDIKELLASEIGKLREMHHSVDKRVAVLETTVGVDVRWGRRAGDHTNGAGGE